MTTSPDQLPFHSFERIATGNQGAVCTSQPLASEAGLAMLKAGGNAFDAALAAAAVLTVVEPAASHLGGDAFIVCYSAQDRQAYAINGSGAAPLETTADKFVNGIPVRGPLSATVPGAVDAWCEVSQRWGKLPLTDVFAAAIHYARDGFPLGHRMSAQLAENREILAEYPDSRDQFVTGDFSTGAIVRQPNLARTLEAIAHQGTEGFYSGPVAQEMVRAVREMGGLLSEEDLKQHSSSVGDPLRTAYRDVEVLAQPPVSQGHTLLQQLNIVEAAKIDGMNVLSPDTIHLLIEAKKLAFADRDLYLGDPNLSEIPLEWLLSKGYARDRANRIDMRRANPQPLAGQQRGQAGTDTTYLAAADGDGNAVSWIQSVFHRFGSGVVAGRTGVVLNNRLSGFTIEPNHVNSLAPGKRPAHTLNAYILSRNGRPWLIGGAPGGDYQTQTNLQIITHVVDFGLNIAEAIDAPWWGSDDGNDVLVESRMAAQTVQELQDRGHNIDLLGGWQGRRTVQLVQMLSSGALLASSDVRNEGHPAVW